MLPRKPHHKGFRPRQKPLARTAPMKRSRTPMKRSRLAPVNKERRATTFARVFGSSARVRFVKSLPCSVPGCDRRDIENAHMTIGGMGYRADADAIAPLCARHHAEQEGRTAAFEREKGLPEGFLLTCAQTTARLCDARGL